MANIQKKVQPFQIEQHKLDVGSIRGYIPSDENASKTLVVRNDNNETHIKTLIADEIHSTLKGKFEGDAEGSFTGDLTGNVTGNLTGNVKGNVDATNIKARVIDAYIDGAPTYDGGKISANLITGHFKGSSDGDHTGTFVGNVQGTFSGTIHGDVEGNLTGQSVASDAVSAVNIFNTNLTTKNVEAVSIKSEEFLGTLRGDSEGTHTGPVVGDITGNADSASKLKSPIKLKLVGPLEGNAEFDGSEDIVISTNLNADSNSMYRTIHATEAYILDDDTKLVYRDENNDAYTLADIKTVVINQDTGEEITYLDLAADVRKEGKDFYTVCGQTVKVSDGGTGTTSINGIIKGNGTAPFSAANPGTDYVTNESVGEFTNKIIDLDKVGNDIKNIKIDNFSQNSIATAFGNAASSSKIPTEKAVKDFVEKIYTGLSWKNSVICATTESLNFETDFVAGNIIDGVELQTNDRILIKNQSLSAENGIYIVRDSGRPIRAEDANTEAEITSSAVYVTKGTKNGNTGWVCSSVINALNVDAIMYYQFSGTNLYMPGKGIEFDGKSIQIDDTVATKTEEQVLTNKTIYGEFHGDLIGNSTGCTGNAATASLATTAINVAGDGTVNAKSATFSGKVEWEGGNSEYANIAYTERRQWDGNNVGLNPETGRTSLQLGTISTQDANDINISGGKIKGITPLEAEFGGTGANLKGQDGLLKISGIDSKFSIATPGEDYITSSSTDDLINKTIDGEKNTIQNIDTGVFKDGIIGADPYFAENSDDIIPTQKAVKTYVDSHLSGAIWKTPVRCVSLNNIDIVTELKPDAVIDDVVVKKGDRVLLKNQILPAENGVYVITENSSVRADDFNDSAEFNNAAIIVLEGSLGGTSWICVTKNPVLLTTPIEWRIYGQKVVSAGDGIKYNLNSIVADFDVIAGVSNKQTLLDKTFDSDSTKFSNLDAEAGTLEFDLNHKGNIIVKSQGNGNKIYTLPKNEGSLYGAGSQVIPVNDGGTGLSTIGRNKIFIGESDTDVGLLTVSEQAKSILSKNDIPGYIAEYLDLTEVAKYTPEVLEEKVSHEFIRKDGSNSFTSPVSGVRPTLPNQLATKDYVDSTVTGVRYLTSVQTRNYANPNILPDAKVGYSYLIPENAEGEWTGKDNQIAKLISNAGNILSWEYTSAANGDTIYIVDIQDQMQWNGEKWLSIGKPIFSSHRNLADIKGGEWHLSEKHYQELFVDSEPVTTHTHAHNNLYGLQGGSANQKWHLSDTQYKDLTGQYESSTIHKHDHNAALINIQGGKAGEKYHLSLEQYNALTKGNNTSLHKHAHNELTSVNGDGDYHLSSVQFNALTKGGTVELHNHIHNSGKDIQGGTENERYHLSRTQYMALISGDDTKLHRHSHDDLVDIIGGKDGERYHIDAETYSRLLNNDFGIKSHKQLQDLQGGKEDERYHLPYSKYEEIISFNGVIGKHNGLTDLQGGNENERYHLTYDERTYVRDRLISGISHSELRTILGNGSYHLSRKQLEELTTGKSTDLHRHDNYVKIDGSVGFTGAVSGVTPTEVNHLATKEYVDYIASAGLRWKAPVKSMDIIDSTIVPLIAGERYGIPRNANGSWQNKYGYIAVATEDQWTFITAEENDTVYDQSTNCSYTWNGEEWIQISASPVKHADLANLNGGDWHLSKYQFNQLTNGTPTDLHYHPEDRVLENSTGVLSAENGGTGISDIPSNRFIYSDEIGHYSLAPITSLGRNILASASFADLRNVLPYGSLATQDYNAVNITGGKITGIEPLGVAYGGTGTTNINGIVKGTGTNKLEAAVPDVDYVTPNGKVTLKNKSIDARSSGNNISNLNLSDFESNVISTDYLFSAASNEKVPTELAVKTYVDSKTTGEENGVHSFISQTHKFDGAIANSVLVFTGEQNNPAIYKTFVGDSTINITDLENTIKFSLGTSVVIDNKSQTLSNKVLKNPVIQTGEWANAQHNHTSEDTGGKITEDAIEGIISISKGGTGLSSIEKNDLIYAVADNKFGAIKLGKFMIDALTSATYTDFVNKIDNSLTDVKYLELSPSDNDSTFVPTIKSLANLNIDTVSTLNITSKNVSILANKSSGNIHLDSKEMSVDTPSGINVNASKTELDYKSYQFAEKRGLILNDNIKYNYTKASATLTINGTFAIHPTIISFSDTTKEISQSNSELKYTSVILLTADDSLAKDYSVDDLKFTLEDPANCPGQCIFLKLITACQVTINAINSTIDGENSVILNQKFMSVRVYSDGTEWFII